MKRTLLICLLCLALSACTVAVDGPVAVVENEKPSYGTSVNVIVSRHIDEEAGVVCWTHHPRGGISCLPIGQTFLGVP